MSVEVGGIVEGTVSKLAHFGVFVRLPNGDTGLVHISEIADAYVSDVADYFDEGDAVKVKVLNVKDGGRYELSVKQAEARKPKSSTPLDASRRREAMPSGKPPGSFEDRLSDFLKTSEQRLATLRRNRDAKRRRRRR
jgi:S1 RNA binding domain protein